MNEALAISAATRVTLAADLRRLGVAAGDTLFIHSSFKSLGPVNGGAETVVRALEDAVRAEGTLLMPVFNLIEKGHEKRAAMWEVNTTPSSVGWLTEYFRILPGTVRSDHYSHSVAARGRRADEFVAGHRSFEGPRSPWDLPPWGKTFGAHSPMWLAYEDPDGKVLMIGVEYHSSTYCHLIEVLDWNRRLAANPQAEYRWINRETLGAYWDTLGRLQRGQVGQAPCRLFAIRDFVDTLRAAVMREPNRWFKQ
jgi:aminoglycoside 3-N-acetyltransferase